MRILISHYFQGQGGGAESIVRGEIEALQKLGHEAAISTQSLEVSVHSFKPDLIHFHTIHVTEGLRPLEWAQEQGIPHCISLHDYWPFCGNRSLLVDYDKPCSAVKGVCNNECGLNAMDTYGKIVNKSPVVVFNPYTAEIMKRNGIRVDAVIPHGVDTEFWNRGDEEKVKGSVVCTSAWPKHPMKGVKYLEEAAQMSRTNVLLITGRPREVVRDALRKADIFVLPSVYEETWALVMEEAMACGCFVIATEVAGPRFQQEQVAQRYGLNYAPVLVAPRNATALATALERVKKMKREDIELAQKCAADWVAKFATQEQMYRAYVDLYEKLW